MTVDREATDIVGVHVPGPPAPESRYYEPTDDCPHPELWTSTDDDSTEIEVSDLAWGLVRATQPAVCVETGAAWGQTAQRIGDALAANGHGHLYTLEPDGRRAAATRERVAGLPVTVVEAGSMDWEPPGPVGFAWLDSLYPLRVPEFVRYSRWLLPGAVVCFHDTAPGHGDWALGGRDLRSIVVDELAGLVALLHLPTPRGVTVGVVL